MSAPRLDDRLLDLLAQRATEGLSPREELELRGLLADAPGVEADWLGPAAAAIDRTVGAMLSGDAGRSTEPMPAALRAKLLADGTAALSGSDTHVSGPVAIDPVQPTAPRRVASPILAWAGWAAAAAVLAWAVLTRPAPAPGPGPEAPIVAASPAEARERLIAEAGDLVRAEWAPSDDPVYGAVRGDVVWSSERREGYMRLTGLPANDPAVRQYQLWIVDPARDANPVDGGVFDIRVRDGEAIVPIEAKLPVDRPAAFAITVEKPGGVVVSAGPLRVVAPVDAA